MLDELSSQTCEQEVLACLKELPSGLTETYQRILDKVATLPTARRLLALKVFFWTITVRRPVSIAEMRILLSVQPRDKNPDQRRFIIDAEKTIYSVCAGLIQYRGSQRSIHPTHFTVTEYLDTYFRQEQVLKEIMGAYQTLDLRSNDSLATAVCLRYLSYDFVTELATTTNPAEATAILQEPEPKFALLLYAIENWPFHFISINDPERGAHSPFFYMLLETGITTLAYQ
ncbi:hypothetical protein CC80DRAFT_553667 [Byssothecium circinans]|uniref:Uncharacterized protein n=1 Tax=Byssothecium circinans TaxID=147558 RepID=A0A6A5TEG0_9PLEO|nr:hypothetical protein CC80DRAFT_553667 [Byssothecium circinans]